MRAARAVPGATAGTRGRPICSPPAQSLLAAAPWIVVRGNHEIVQSRRAGLVAYSSTRVRSRRGRIATTRSTTRPATTASPTRCRLASCQKRRHSAYRVRFVAGRRRAAVAGQPDARQVSRAVRARVRARREAVHHVLRDHHPSRCVGRHPAASPTRRFGATGRRSRLGHAAADRAVSAEREALLAGHVHLFEVVSFSTGQPAQFVSGNGGDWVDVPLPYRFPPERRPRPEPWSRAPWRRTGSAS